VWFDLDASGGFQQLPLLQGKLRPSAEQPLFEQWIVVTSINPPTPAIKLLATLPSWRVVVIGDSKTPKDWAWPNVTFLSVEAQQALGFSTTQLLRTRSYQRKNIGYLYAALHGARVIYETDDDNALVLPDVPLVKTSAVGSGAARLLEYASDALTLNHHAHFGQPSTWPRGYPLEAIAEPQEPHVRRAPVTPAVQQGLANGDPDVDAVFRMTRKPVDLRVDFAFDDAEPIALPFGSFGPYNAQNTVFTYEGLWALVLPQTVEFRVCDIWRSYFTQRLLWGIGAQLVFMPPSVYQLRNVHSYHDDYLSEAQIFDQVTSLLQWLRTWSCPVQQQQGAPPAAELLVPCAYALAADMASAGFWGPGDAELVRHFLHDLGRLGYAFPPWTEQLSSGGYTRACSAEGGGGGCPGGAPGEAAAEALHSQHSIVLYGTCTAELPPAAWGE